MRNDLSEIKNAVYEGVCIYNTLKNLILIIEGERVLQDDKKFLSLYLGLINLNNSISKKNSQNEINMELKINYEKLDKEAYYYLYNESFKNILSEVNFNSITEYLNSLLFKDVVIKFNREYTKYIKGNNFNKGNKLLVKK